MAETIIDTTLAAAYGIEDIKNLPLVRNRDWTVSVTAMGAAYVQRCGTHSWRRLPRVSSPVLGWGFVGYPSKVAAWCRGRLSDGGKTANNSSTNVGYGCQTVCEGATSSEAHELAVGSRSAAISTAVAGLLREYTGRSGPEPETITGSLRSSG